MCKLDIVITALQIKQNNCNDTSQVDKKVVERYYARERALKDAERIRKKKKTKAATTNNTAHIRGVKEIPYNSLTQQLPTDGSNV